MKLQLALDRISIEEAIELAEKTEDFIDWIEVGTSLIKEFGTSSIRAMKTAFPKKIIVADMKTNDNALYECELGFGAGADIITVMGTAPRVTIETCVKEAEKRGKMVMIDLLNTSSSFQFENSEAALLCVHKGKDDQEKKADSTIHERWPENARIAVAGGITLKQIPVYQKLNPAVLIVGTAITKAADPAAAAKAFQKAMKVEEQA